MQNSTLVFKGPSYAYIAGLHNDELEKIISAGLVFEKRKWVKNTTSSRLIEQKAALIIAKIIGAIHPDFSKHIHDMDRELIWRIFWKRRQHQTGPTKLSIFQFLYELETKPSLIKNS